MVMCVTMHVSSWINKVLTEKIL